MNARKLLCLILVSSISLNTYAIGKPSKSDFDLRVERASDTYKRVYSLCTESYSPAIINYVLASAVEPPLVFLEALSGQNHKLVSKMTQNFYTSELLEDDINDPSFTTALDDCGLDPRGQFWFLLNVQLIDFLAGVASIGILTLAAVKSFKGLFNLNKKMKNKYPKTMRSLFWLTLAGGVYQVGKMTMGCDSLLAPEVAPAQELNEQSVIDSINEANNIDVGELEKLRLSYIAVRLDEIDSEMHGLDVESDEYKDLESERQHLLKNSEL